MSSELAAKSLSELSGLIRRREVSPVELTAAVLDEVDRHNYTVNAYISIYRDDAHESASRAEAEIAAGRYRGPLHGIPMGLKDNLYCQGMVTTMGSKIHGQYVPDHNATVVDKLRQAGIVLLGKLNLHEYALGVTTDNPWFGTCRNPWDLDRSPGGSSGGSAAALATGMTVATLGTDTSGSIRIPAALCGVVGLKPTYGRVSKYGCFPEAWTLDHIGPMTRTVTDAAMVLDVLSGYDARDPASLDLPPTQTAQALSGDAEGLVVGIEESYFFSDLDDEIAARVWTAISGLESAGATVRRVELPGLQHCDYALTVIDTAEASTVHHANLRDRRQDYGDDVRLLLECGELPSAVEYLQAQQIRHRLRSEVRRAFDQVDVLVSPMVPAATPAIGASTILSNGRPVEVGESLMRMVGPGSLLGLPSLSVPCGVVDGMPVGLQIIGPPLGEQQVLDAGRAVELLDLMGAHVAQGHLGGAAGS